MTTRYDRTCRKTIYPPETFTFQQLTLNIKAYSMNSHKVSDNSRNSHNVIINTLQHKDLCPSQALPKGRANSSNKYSLKETIEITVCSAEELLDNFAQQNWCFFLSSWPCPENTIVHFARGLCLLYKGPSLWQCSQAKCSPVSPMTHDICITLPGSQPTAKTVQANERNRVGALDEILNFSRREESTGQIVLRYASSANGWP